jgi:hypothetical protein
MGSDEKSLASAIAVAGIGLTALYWTLDPAHSEISIWIRAPIGLLGAALLLWSIIWWILIFRRGGHLALWRVPLRNALQLCFETTQSSAAGPWVSAEYSTEHKRFDFMLCSLIAHRAPMFGREQGSRIAYEIPQPAMKNLQLVEGTSNLQRIAGREGSPEYLDVYMRRPDLWRQARRLKNARGLDDI